MHHGRSLRAITRDGCDPQGVNLEINNEDPENMRLMPCSRQRAPWPAHCCGSTVIFILPFTLCFSLTRFIASGHLDWSSFVLMLLSPVLAASFCCRYGCCQPTFCFAAWTGIVLSSSLTIVALFNRADLIHVSGAFNATKRIAIIGGGPSGTTAAWILALNNPNAVIDIYEYNQHFGGHSETVKVEGNVPIDIGFIFSTPLYTMYNALCDHFNVSRKQSSISVHYHGGRVNGKRRLPWTNLQGGAGTVFTEAANPERSARLTDDISRFMQLSNASKVCEAPGIERRHGSAGAQRRLLNFMQAHLFLMFVFLAEHVGHDDPS